MTDDSVPDRSPPATPGDSGPVPEDVRSVEGRLLSEYGEPADGVAVRLYDVGFGGEETLLDETKTDKRGSYRLAYGPDTRVASIEIRAVASRGRETPLSVAPFAPARREKIDLVVPAAARPRSAEFDRLRTDVEERLGSFERLADAREDEEQRDLTVLRAATGWDARLLATAAQTISLSVETGIAPDALYAAARAGLPTDAESLASIGSRAFREALRKARAAGVVSSSPKEQAAAGEAFDRFAKRARLETPVPGTVSSLDELLRATGVARRQKLTAQERATFAQVYFASSNDGGDLWQAARKAGIPKDKVDALALQGKLAYLTLNNAPLAAAVQRQASSTDDLSWLVDRDYHKRATWEARLRTLASSSDATLDELVPGSYAGDSSAERLAAYADDLAAKVRESFPTRVVARMVEENEIRAVPDQVARTKVALFLQQAASLGFELGQVPFTAFVEEHRKKLFPTAADEATAAETLDHAARLTRLYQVTPTDDALGVLARNGFDSAQDVVAFTPDEFVRHCGDQFASAEEAELTYAKAQQVQAVTQNVVVMGAQVVGMPPTQVTASSSQAIQAAKASLIKRFPTMESLFDSLDFCECEHCRSVLSPAAYLVDLLKFLDPDTKVWTAFKSRWKATHNQTDYPHGTPYEALTARRPDLPGLPLTCENTHTALPYIDIVNEILECFIANRLDSDAAHDTGTATTPELLAEPQHILESAYHRLKDARYPLRLPFDLWLETVRRFSEHFEIPLWKVLETFRPNDQLFPPSTSAPGYYWEAIFVESLGLSPSQHAIFVDDDPLSAWYDLYGYGNQSEALTVAIDADGQRIDLHSAKALARRLGVSYKELVTLVGTWFVNPELERLVVLRKLDVDPSAVFRYMQHPAYTPFTAEERAAFEARLDALTTEYNPTGDPASFDARAWITNAWPAGFREILVLADPQGGCDFDKTTLRYADGSAADSLVFLRLNLFVRLWKTLGWTIEDIDRALQAFVPRGSLPLTGANIGPGLRTALIYMAHLAALDGQVKAGRNSRQKLLAIWSDLATTGKNPLYAQLFLTPTVLRNSPEFDDPLGDYLSQPNVLVKDHLLAVQGALSLAATEVALVLEDAGLKLDTAPLSLANVSLLYRHGLLAKALKIPVRDLLAVKELSGIDPCSQLRAAPLAQLDDDYPFARTLRFVEVVEQVRGSGFSVEELDYLLRNRFDAAGPFRPAADLPATFIRSLAAGVRRIESDHAAPSDPLLITDDFLREKLELVFPGDAVNEFFSYWTDSAEFSATKAGVVPGKKLAPTTYETGGLRVVYDETRNRQQLVHVGVLSDTKKASILQAIPAPPSTAPQGERDAYAVFTELLDAIAAQSQPRPRAFFEKCFGEIVTYDDLYGTSLAPPTQVRRRAVSGAILPFVRQKLARQLAVQTAATELAADPSLTEALVADRLLLQDPSSTAQQRPALLDAFLNLGGAGATAELFAASDLTGTRLASSGTVAGVSVAAGSGANSARFRGYFEVPEAGPYRFYGRFANAVASATLSVSVQPERTITFSPTQSNLEVSDPNDFVELEPGVLYEFAVEARNLQGGDFRVLIQGETLPKDDLGQLTLYPYSAVERARNALILLRKSLRLVTGLELSERELRYFLTHAADFGGLDLSKLPVRRLGNTAADVSKLRALFSQFLRLADYAELKRGPGGGTDDLIGVFERARATHDASDADAAKTLHFTPLAEQLRREPAAVRAAAEALRFSITATAVGSSRRVETPDLADERGLRRLWEALQLVETFGVAVETIVDATRIIAPGATADKRFEIARDLRNAVRARYESETWQRTAQAVFDKLRRSQRDALVDYVMHDRGFDRLEQLFEYFLIDPGMEPVVQTSRLRLAISSVQVFVQRCLLNLELEVHPSAIINSDHWQWMKRYRVWEANRKIFLFPENWLEPEFRDDKTHIFRELEGELFQDDISNDLAETAFLTYLRKLDELARLDIVAMHLEERSDPSSNVLHVIGRTFNLPHQYFHRRYAHRMWTPWGPIAADIEGDHIVATVWRDRLHVFWLTILDKPAMENDPSSQVNLNEGMSLTKAVERQIEIQLNWCEQLEGEWATRSSSGFANPARATVAASFDGRDGYVHAITEQNADGSEGALVIHLSGSFVARGEGSLATAAFPQAFRLESKNSPPRVELGVSRRKPPYVTLSETREPTQYGGGGALQVILNEHHIKGPVKDTVLSRGRSATEPSFSLLPTNEALGMDTSRAAALVSPFFYANDQHSFFVEPRVRQVPVKDYEGFGIDFTIVELDKDDLWQDLPINVEVPTPRERVALTTDPRAKYTLRKRGDWLTDDVTLMRFGETLVGREGLAEDVSITEELATDVVGSDLGGAESSGDVVIVDSHGAHPRLIADIVDRELGVDGARS